MKRKNCLKSGKKIGICAPSARFDRQKFDQGIGQLQSLGFSLVIPQKIFDEKRYLAGDDLQRATLINQFFSDPKIDGIICARGGFGAMRILEHLDWELIKNNPKPFIGFSDITAILLSIIDRTGNPVIHGPTVVSLATPDPRTIESLYQVLTNPDHPFDLFCEKTLKSGKTCGQFKGGNISTISHLMGTPFIPDFKESILFLEEINEPAYKIDRMLIQMKMAGCFDHIQGIVTGSFEHCENAEYIEQILVETFDDCQVPVLTGLACGHGPVNLSLPMGLPVILDADSRTISWNR
ncbi:MAG: LD-carboxypeptidase [Pseudomonadota bacterium]